MTKYIYLILLLGIACKPSPELTTLNISDISISFPNNWRVETNTDFLFYSHLNDSLADTYLLLNQINGITPKFYLDTLSNLLKADSIEVLTEHQVHELTLDYSSEPVYYGQFSFNKDTADLVYFMMIWNKQDVLYELGMKTQKANYEEAYKTFQTTLYSLTQDNQPIFKKEFELEFEEIEF